MGGLLAVTIEIGQQLWGLPKVEAFLSAICVLEGKLEVAC